MIGPKIRSGMKEFCAFGIGCFPQSAGTKKLKGKKREECPVCG